MIVTKLTELGETRAADWFSKTWCEDAYWMVAYVSYGCVLHNNSIEGSWRWLKESAKVYGKRSTIQVFTLMLFRYMTDHSEKQQHELIRLGHTFSRSPEISRDIWIALQKMPVRCIEMFRVVTRKGIENSDFTAGQADFEPYMRAVMQAEGDKLYHKILNADHPPDTGILMANFPTHLTIDRPSAVPSKKIGLENFEYAGKSSSSEQDDFEEPAPPPLPAKKSLDFSCMEDIPVGGRQKRKVKPDDYV